MILPDRIIAGLLAFALAFFPPLAFAQTNIIGGGLRGDAKAGSSVAFGLTAITKVDSSSGCTLVTTTLTCTGVAFGTADPTRQMAFGISSRNSATFTIVSVTVNTTLTATSVIDQPNVGANANRASIFIDAVPTGTTGTIVVVFNSTILRAAVTVYRIVGTGVVAGLTAPSTATNPTSGALTIPAGGGTIGVGTFANAVSTTMTNLTQDFSAAIGATSTVAAAGSNTSASGSTTFTITPDASTEPVGVFANFHP